MKVLIICSSENNTKIVSSITEAWDKYIAADGRRSKESPDRKKQSDILVIKLLKTYEALHFDNDVPDFVFIQNEIQWGPINKITSGYEIALDIILHKLKDHFFNLQFISFDSRKDLMRTADDKYKKLVQMFSHLNMTNLSTEVSFEKNMFTPLHFELVKALVLDDANRINVIEHDIDTIKGNIASSAPELNIDLLKSKLQNQIDELSILKFIADDKILKLQQSIDKSTRREMLKANVSELEKIITEAKERIQNPNNEEFSAARKTNYKVLIIEDEIEWRRFFSDTFSEIYQSVFPGNRNEVDNFLISEAREIIKSKSDSHIFILDLLYKNSDDFWLPFNGLDLYQIVKELNPYACIRIITSLPRDIVSKVSGLLLKTDIKISHVFTKKVGQDRLKFAIYDRVLEINSECKENEKQKTVFKPIPKLGIFAWDGINDFLFRLMTADRDKYEESWDKAFKFYELFASGKLSQSTEDWNSGQLPTPKKKKSATGSYILERLPVILTHRLLIIKKALDDLNLIIDAEIYETDVLNRVCNILTFDKGYIQTKLGFNATPYENIEHEVSGFKIGFKNLFPEEVLFIARVRKANFRPASDDLRKYADLFRWFTSLLCDLDIYESWEELKLDYYPYVSVDRIDKSGKIESNDIDAALTIWQLEGYLCALVKNSHNEFVQKIIDQTIEYYIDTFSSDKEMKIPLYLRGLIDDLLEKT